MKFHHLSQVIFGMEAISNGESPHTQKKKKSRNIYSKSPCKNSYVFTGLGHLHNFTEYSPKCSCISLNLKSVWSIFTADLYSFCIVHIRWFIYLFLNQIMLSGWPFPDNILQNELILDHSASLYILVSWIKDWILVRTEQIFRSDQASLLCQVFSRRILATT